MRYTIQSYWSDSPLTLLEKTCLISWVVFGANVILYTHDPVAKIEKQIPSQILKHVKVVNANVIIPKKLKFEFKGKSYRSKRKDAFKFLPFSDLFRYTMLKKNGGIWMDMDLILLRPIPKNILEAEYFFSSERTMQTGAFASKSTFKPSNAFIGVKNKDSEWANLIVNKSTSSKILSSHTFLKTFNESIDELDLEKHILHPEIVMPVNWWEIGDIFLSDDEYADLKKKKGASKFGVRRTVNDSILKNKKVIGIHLFRGILRKHDVPYDDISKIPGDSLFARILKHIEKKL
jgi:hypothetical protein